MPEQPSPNQRHINGPNAGTSIGTVIPESTAASNGSPLARHEMMEVLDSTWIQAAKMLDEVVTAQLVDESYRERIQNLARKANLQRGHYFVAMLVVSSAGLGFALPSSSGRAWFIRFAVAGFLTALLEYGSIRHGRRTPWRQHERITQAMAGLCRGCGYQLGNEPLGNIRTRRCPECGMKWPLIVPFDDGVEPMT